MRVPARVTVVLSAAALAATGCTGTSPEASNSTSPPASSTPATSSSSIPSAQSSSPSASASAPDEGSLQALMGKKYDGHGLKVGRVLARQAAYTRRFVTYK